MTIGPYDSPILAPLFADPDVSALLSDEAYLRAMAKVEGALARAEGALGVISHDAAKHISKATTSFKPRLDGLAESTTSSGLPVVGFVAQLRADVGGEAASHVHWGATSQDIMDTAFVLQMRAVLDLFEQRLAEIIKGLARLAKQYRDTPMAGRTRSQQALPITFGLKAAGWLAPLVRHLERLQQLRPRLQVVQFGGAAGTLAPLGDKGVKVMEKLASELDLAAPPMPWHVQRDAFAELASWLALVTGALGKLGQDVALLAQTEVGEVREGGEGRGGSSTLPQKHNPIGAETLVTLARLNAGLLGTLHQAVIEEHERGGSGWTLEWAVLPQMAAATGAALKHARDLVADLDVDAGRMRANLDASNGLLLAEAASFALSEHMPRAEAQALVKQACAEAQRSGRHLMDVMAKLSKASVDWKAMKDPAAYLGSAGAFVDRVLKAARRQAAETKAEAKGKPAK